MRLAIFALISSGVLGLPNVARGEVITKPEKDEAITVKCECLAAFSLCELEVFASAAGKPKHSWTQTNYLKKGVKADLNAACYRKRDVAGQGDGLCCSFTGNQAKTISNLFRGTRQ